MKKEGTLLEAKYQRSMTNGRSNEVNRRTQRMYRMLIFAAFLVLHSSFLVSCSESDNSVEEYPNWKEKNENYFNNLYIQTEQKVANYDKDWKILTKWSMQDSISKRSYDHIIVHVLKEGTGIDYPMYTDSVRVHYSGRLLPSTSYPAGLEFDKSYSGTFDPASSIPKTFKCSTLTDGFATAIMNMHIGDQWEIYIPYQLGYGVNGSTDANGKTLIPGYSTLIFNVTLKSFYRANTTPPVFQSKEFRGWFEE